MTVQQMPLPTQTHRIEVEARIVRRLQRMDYDLLVELDAAIDRAESISAERTASITPEQDPAEPPPPPVLTRRQILSRLALGGAALATAGYVATRPAPDAAEEPQDEVARLRTLLGLYEMMEQVGLDGLIGAALTALGLSMEGLRLGATALRGAVDFIAAVLDRVESVVPQIRAGIHAADGFLGTIDGHMDRLEQMIGDVMEEAAPLTQAVDGFVQELLSYLPFGMGERIRAVAQEMAALIGLLPAGVGALRSGLFAPMRAWFPSDDGADLGDQLFAPVRADLLDPTRALLDDLIGFTDRWDSELAGPVHAALAQRAEVRSQIVAYQEGTRLPEQRIG